MHVTAERSALDGPGEHEKPPGPEDMLAAQLVPFGLRFEREYRFAKSYGRQWRFDFAFRQYLVAVEIEGLAPRKVGREIVAGGRHGTVKGIKEDMRKYNAAALLGWLVLRFEQNDVRPRRAIDMTLRVLASRGWRNIA